MYGHERQYTSHIAVVPLHDTAASAATATGALRADMEQLSSRRQPDSIPAQHVHTAWSDLLAIARLAHGAATRLARRLGEDDTWKATGAPDLSDYIANQAGTSKPAPDRPWPPPKRCPTCPPSTRP